MRRKYLLVAKAGHQKVDNNKAGDDKEAGDDGNVGNNENAGDDKDLAPPATSPGPLAPGPASSGLPAPGLTSPGPEAGNASDETFSNDENEEKLMPASEKAK